MKIGKVILAVVVLAGLTVPLVSCAAKSGQDQSPQTGVVTVQKGNLSISITAAGNLALAQTQDLAFEANGYVENVTVQEGDVVTKGTVLANLDASAWNDHITTLTNQLTSAQQQLRAKQRALTDADSQVTTAQNNVTKAERQVTAKEFAVRQAQLDLQTAESNLSLIDEVKEAQDAVDNAEYELKFYKRALAGSLGGALQLSDYQHWSDLEVLAQEKLTQARADLQDILNDTSVKLSSDVALQVAKSQLQVEQSQRQLGDAQVAVDDAKTAVSDAQSAVDEAKAALEDAKINLSVAQKNMDNAQSALNDAVNTSLQVIAPFDGFLTKVNVKGGDEAFKGTVAVQLADPNKFEVSILVSELDIFKVNLGSNATVGVGALPNVNLSAKVTHIAPTATIQSGVVNYAITVEVESPSTSTTPTIPTSQKPSNPSQTPSNQSQTPRTPQAGTGSSAQGGQSGQATQASQNIQLKEGLSVTINLIVAEKDNVLMVPTRAITREASVSHVQVQKADGTTEKRAIQTGMNNQQYTEVTSGLSEGEKVVVPLVTAPATTSSSTPRPGGGIPFISGGR